MKSILITLIICLVAIHSFGQYNDPNFSKPAMGYGADGAHKLGVDSFANPNFAGQYIRIYYPSDIATKVPTIFYSHAFGGYNPQLIIGLINFVVKKGYAFVFVPYQTAGIGVTVLTRYANLLNGFRMAARSYTQIIDTTKVGFMGWSFGGGASFTNAYNCFTTNNWGENGRFIYALAQWYSYNISQAQIQSFPSNTKLLTEVFNDDTTNDHRMAIDIFNNINIPSSEKDFILLKSDTVNGDIYLASHNVPQAYDSTSFNAFDYYAIYRLFDALCDYTFNGNLEGKKVALGNGDSEQISMPTGLKNLIETDTPIAMYPESKYEYPCSGTGSAINTRSSYCSAISDYAIGVSLNIENSGIIAGNGNYTLGQNVLLTATSETGFAFINWTENDSVISTNATYQFIATKNRNLVANFKSNTNVKSINNENSINIYPNPTNGLISFKPIFENETLRIVIFDFMGKKIYDKFGRLK
jgi:hypothetical protein